MAEIFKGLTYDFSGLKKFIVIKRILPHIAVNQDFIRMLIDEAKVAVRLNHGNIAQTYDLGKVAEDYFIVMEYVEGKTLSQIFKKAVSLKQNIPIPLATFLIAEICHGLDYIHRRTDELGKPLGIVHCDISPQNVILSPSGNVKIVDFGVAKAAFKLLEKERGILKGKFAYMSPEQTFGDNVEANSDIFSTGVVLWELLTGRRLFKKKMNSETIEAVQTMTVYPPSAYRNEIPSGLDEIVMKALARDSKRRYGNASDMALELTKFNLKYYPDFKSAQISDFLAELFQDDENTGDIFQEKTQHEEKTALDGEVEPDEEETRTPAEDTLILDPQELNFQSIFEEIDMDDESEITRALPEEEGSQTFQRISEMKEGGMHEPRPRLGGSSEKIQIDIPEVSLERFPEDGRFRRRTIGAAIGLFVILAVFFLWQFFFSRAPVPLNPPERVLKITSDPPGAAIFFDGQTTGQITPTTMEIKKLKFPLKVGLSKGGPPQWTQDLPFAPSGNFKVHGNLNASFATLDVETSPPGALVQINGDKLGQTPLYAAQIQADEKVNLLIQLPGFKPYEKKIFLKSGQNQRISAILQKEPSRGKE